MKQLLALLVLTTCLTATAIANNDNGTKKTNESENTDPEKPVKQTTYKFSLKKSYFNIFNIFSVEPVRNDTIGKRNEESLEDIKSIW